MNYSHTIDKRQVRRAFGQAATGYDQVAVLQREISDRMLSRLEYIRYTPDTILDAGSGTGYGSRKLVQRYPDATLFAVDFAAAMHLQARPRVAWWKQLLPGQHTSQTGYICGDIESLPLKDTSIGMIWSNLTLQWCNDLNQTFAGMHRVLKNEGLLMFSTFGPDTLKELRQAFGHADGHSHVNRFTDMHDIGDILVHHGFSTPVMDMEYLTLTYDDVTSIMRDLKAMGAHNVTQGRQRGLTGKHAWQKVTAQYEQLRHDGRLPATFEVIYGHAWKPRQRSIKDGNQANSPGSKRSMMRT